MKLVSFILFLLLTLPCYSQTDNGKGNGGMNNGGGNGNSQGGAGGGNNGRRGNPKPEPPESMPMPTPAIPGRPIVLAPGEDPKALVSIAAPTVSQVAALPTVVTQSNVSIARQILQSHFTSETIALQDQLTNPTNYAGREIGIWAASHGDFVNEGTPTTRVTTAGVIVATDRRFGCIVLGLAGGYSHSWSNDIDMNTGWGGGYVLWSNKRFYVNETVIGGGSSFETTREGLLGVAKANSASWFFSENTQIGYNFKFNKLTIGPYALLQYALSGNGTFSEHGSDAPVTIHSNSDSSLVSDVGLNTSYEFKRLIFNTNIAWEHEYTDTTSFTTVNIVGIPSSATTIAGSSLGHDSIIVSAGIAYKLSDRVSIGVGYNGQFLRKNYESNSVTATIKIGF